MSSARQVSPRLFETGEAGTEEGEGQEVIEDDKDDGSVVREDSPIGFGSPRHERVDMR